MRWVVILLGGVLALAIVVVVIGMLLPAAHSATVRARYARSPDQVYAVIRDVAQSAAWRSGLERVDVLPDDEGRMRWRETAEWGTITFERIEDVPPRRLVTRVVDEGHGFGGTWTYEIAPDGDGSVVMIREDGFVANPVYRFMTRFVMGYYASLETYAADLARRLDVSTNVERVAPGE